MKLQYNIPSMGQLRRDLMIVIEAHSTGTDESRAQRDAFICLVCDLLVDGGYTADQLGMLVVMAADLEANGRG